MRIAVATILVAALFGTTLPGCAHEARTVTTTETVECEEAPDPYFEDELDEAQECREVRRETTVVTEHDPGCHGLVSCSFRIVGSVVSLPFRILGEVLDTVF